MPVVTHLSFSSISASVDFSLLSLLSAKGIASDAAITLHTTSTAAFILASNSVSRRWKIDVEMNPGLTKPARRQHLNTQPDVKSEHACVVQNKCFLTPIYWTTLAFSHKILGLYTFTLTLGLALKMLICSNIFSRY